MRANRSSLARSAGFALQDLLFTVTIVSVLVGIGASLYAGIRDNVGAEDQAQRMVEVAADLRRFMGKAQGTYTGLTPARVNALGMVRQPMRWDGTAIRDKWNNAMDFYGQGPWMFSMVAGGANSPMSPSDCAALATKLANGAWSVRVGSAVVISKSGGTDGNVTGGSLYKSGAIWDQSALTTGCPQANTVVGAMFFER